MSSPDEVLDNEEVTSPRSTSAATALDSAPLHPLHDRLGWTLTDAAPHTAVLAGSLPSQPVLSSSNGLSIAAPSNLAAAALNEETSLAVMGRSVKAGQVATTAEKEAAELMHWLYGEENKVSRMERYC